MVRSVWKRTLVTSLAWAGLVVAQQPASSPRPAPAPVQSAEQIVTLQEQGKPAHKCRIIKSWRTKEGGKAFLLVAIATGEKLTVVESGPSTSVPGTDSAHRQQAIATRIYHWGRESNSPAGAPIPPADQPVVLTSRSTPTPTLSPIANSTAPSSSAATCCQPSKDTCCTTTEVLTEMPKRSFINPKTWFQRESKDEVVVAQSPVKSSKDCVCTPTMPQVPVTNVSLAKQDTGTKPATAAATTESKPVAATATAPAQPSDWRRSWGKSDDFSVPASPATTTTGIKPGAVATPLPQAATDKPDPLTMPNKYSQLAPKYTGYAAPAQPTITATNNDKKTVDATTTSTTKTTTPAAQSAVISTPAAPSVQAIPTTAPTGPVIISGPAPGMPVIISGPAPGMTYAPVHIATMPDLHGTPSPLTTRVPQPPQAPQLYPQRPMVSAAQPARPWANEPVTNVPGMANAFTSTPSTQKIAENANAFGDGTGNIKPSIAPGTTGPSMAPQNAVVQTIPEPVLPPMNTPGFASISSHSSPVNHSSATQTNYNLPNTLKAGSPAEMMSMLKDSPYPSQREYAADCLSACDWHTNPAIVDSLLSAASKDPAPSVRAGCVHCLAKMHVNNLATMNTLQALKLDTDPVVRGEVEAALAQMK